MTLLTSLVCCFFSFASGDLVSAAALHCTTTPHAAPPNRPTLQPRSAVSAMPLLIYPLRIAAV